MAARITLLQALESDRYLALLERLETGAQSPVVVDATVSLADIAGAEFKTLRRAMEESGPDASDNLLHHIRIQGKRARYAAELAERSVGKPATRFLRQDKALQDLLGEHHDAWVISSDSASSLGRRVARSRRSTLDGSSSGNASGVEACGRGFRTSGLSWKSVGRRPGDRLRHLRNATLKAAVLSRDCSRHP